MTVRKKRREPWGKIRKLPSGRFQASYVLPEEKRGAGDDGKRHNAPVTFDNMTDARAWLAMKRAEILNDTWRPVSKRTTPLFGEYAREHIKTRTNSRGEALKPSTRAEYLRLLSGPLSEFENLRLNAIKPDTVRRWNAAQLESGTKTQTARAYVLLKSVLATAVGDGLLASNPCQIKGGAKASTGKQIAPPTDAELAIIVATIDQRLALLVEVAAWGGLRWGEITELRRGDVMFQGDVATLAIARAVTYTKTDGFTVGKPKSLAGVRTVALPATLTPALRARLAEIAPHDNALLFPSLSDPDRHFSAGSFAQYFRTAREAAGRPDMPFHALRHFGLTRYAMAGATTKELMRRAGHNSVAVAMRYQHEAGRDGELAARMSALG
jgi:integrase